MVLGCLVVSFQLSRFTHCPSQQLCVPLTQDLGVGGYLFFYFHSCRMFLQRDHWTLLSGLKHQCEMILLLGHSLRQVLMKKYCVCYLFREAPMPFAVGKTSILVTSDLNDG